MNNQSKGSGWVLPVIIGAAVIIVALGVWLILKKPSSNTPANTNTSMDQTSTDSNSMNNSSGQTLEFPWSNYQTNVNVAAHTTSASLIGQTIDIGGFSTVTLAIGQTIDIGGATTVGTVYAFNQLTLGGAATISKLYVESSTGVTIARDAKVGQKFVLSHNDLVTQAEAAAGINAPSSTGSSPAPASSPASSTPKPAPAPAPNPTPSPTPTVAAFAGQWNGSYVSTLSSGACKASGAVSLSINSSGTATGYSVVNGVQTPGQGTVDANGNLSGSWNYTGLNITYSGRLNSSAGTGSGTYRDNVGCTGSFTVSR